MGGSCPVPYSAPCWQRLGLAYPGVHCPVCISPTPLTPMLSLLPAHRRSSIMPCNCRDVAVPAPGQAQTLLMAHSLRDKRPELPTRERPGDRTSCYQPGTSLPQGHRVPPTFLGMPIIPAQRLPRYVGATGTTFALYMPALAWLGPQTEIVIVGSVVITEAAPRLVCYCRSLTHKHSLANCGENML